MKRIAKWLAIGLGSIMAVALLVIYGVSEYRLRQTFDIPATPITIPVGMASLARGHTSTRPAAVRAATARG